MRIDLTWLTQNIVFKLSIHASMLLRVVLLLVSGSSGITALWEGFEHDDHWLSLEDTFKSVSKSGMFDRDEYWEAYLDGVVSVTTPQSEENVNRRTNQNRTSISCLGYKDIPNKIPMLADTHFPIASNSKLYTTVAIYQLHEQGLLDVDADIATMLDHEDFENFGLQSSASSLKKAKKFCPKIAGRISWKCEKITLRNLLSMSSGIYPSLNCDTPQRARGRCNPDVYFVNRGSIGKTVGTFILEPLMFRPGTKYHYSNDNFILAAYFVEKYNGVTFRNYLETNIFSRIGLKNTYFDFYNQGLELDTARAGQYFKYYDKFTGDLMSVGAEILQVDLGVSSGSGGIVSTVQDQVTFWYSLFNKTMKGAPLLSSADSYNALLTPWTFMNKQSLHLPSGEQITIWFYYTQGTIICCESKKCVHGPPKWIMYAGGLITVLTANVLEFKTFKMAQVWTSTVVAMTDQKSFQDVFDRQTDSVLDIVGKWRDPFLNNPTLLALMKLYENTTETTTNEEEDRKQHMPKALGQLDLDVSDVVGSDFLMQ